MTEEELDAAHLVLEAYQDVIVAVGAAMLQPLNSNQREYVITKMHDEFRFWRVEEQLT